MSTTVKRFRALSFAAFICLTAAVTTLPAAAADGAVRSPNRFVSGPFVGTGLVDGACPGGVHVTDHYTYGAGQPPFAAGTEVAQGCANVTTVPISTKGTFVITAQNGAVLTGTLAGHAGAHSITYTETVTSGTRQFKDVTGTIDVTATFTGTNPKTITGTFVPHLTRTDHGDSDHGDRDR